MKKFITLLLFICTLLLAFNLLFKAAPVYAEEEPRPSLIDDIIPKNKEKLKYEEYPPSSYGIDVYTPEGGFGESLKFWKWKDNIKEQIVATIFILISIGWSVNLAISSFVTSMVGQSMSLNIVADVGDKLGDVISKAAGFNGSWSNGIYSELIGLMLALLACWVIWVGFVQRRQSEMLGGLLKALGILVFTLGFFANSSYIIKGLNTFSEQVNKTVLDSTQSISGASEGYSSGVDSITDLTHTLLIKQPYTLLQFGTTNMKKIGDERTKKMLTTTDPDERKALLKDEVEVQKNQTLSLDATFERGALVLLLGAINLPLWIVLGLCSMAMLFYQLMFIIVALMSPVMLLMALVPPWTGTAKRFLAELFRTLLMKVAIGFLVTLMFWVSSILFSATDKYGYLVVAALQVLSFLGVWLYRKTIFDAITTVPASTGAARASDAMSNIRQKYRDVRRGSKSVGRGVAVAGAAGVASAAMAGKVGKSGYSKFKQLKENYADRKEKVADGKRKEKEQMQAEKEKNINQMKKEENLGVRDRKGNQEQERVKEEVAATKENQELAVRGKHQDNDSEIQQAELKDKEEDVKAEVKPVAAIKIPTGQTKSTDDKPIIIPQSGTTPIPANPIESKPITTPQSGTTPLQSNPIESKPITTPQSGTTPIPANPIESKPITIPQSGTTPLQSNPIESKPITTPQSGTTPIPANPIESKPITTPQSGTTPIPANPIESKPITIPQSGTTPIPANPVESKPVTTSHVSTPQKQVEVKQVNQQQNKNIPKVNNQQHVKEGADIKKVNAKAQTQQEALKNVKAKETIKLK
ncbi:CD3337/EF1877 family mobilome membrane protein [Bacillus cereus]|uniref:CD3337/EF1877 family mobilome membrane protein n=1 Tax=Bacillus cereus TaxID=1396 RepID=UPI00065B8AB3|nr:membrane protein [Bacillus cereus]KMP50433.1 membrane protein [Bacillus cereus]